MGPDHVKQVLIVFFNDAAVDIELVLDSIRLWDLEKKSVALRAAHCWQYATKGRDQLIYSKINFLIFCKCWAKITKS